MSSTIKRGIGLLTFALLALPRLVFGDVYAGLNGSLYANSQGGDSYSIAAEIGETEKGMNRRANLEFQNLSTDLRVGYGFGNGWLVPYFTGGISAIVEPSLNDVSLSPAFAAGLEFRLSENLLLGVEGQLKGHPESLEGDSGVSLTGTSADNRLVKVSLKFRK